jgi:hypothetical protein
MLPRAPSIHQHKSKCFTVRRRESIAIDFLWLLTALVNIKLKVSNLETNQLNEIIFLCLRFLNFVPIDSKYFRKKISQAGYCGGNNLNTFV